MIRMLKVIYYCDFKPQVFILICFLDAAPSIIDVNNGFDLMVKDSWTQISFW